MSENDFERKPYFLISTTLLMVSGIVTWLDAWQSYFKDDCLRCNGTGRLTCSKCAGYGYCTKRNYKGWFNVPELIDPSLDQTLRGYKKKLQMPRESQASRTYLCPFCDVKGTIKCLYCHGNGERKTLTINMDRFLDHTKSEHSVVSVQHQLRAFSLHNGYTRPAKNWDIRTLLFQRPDAEERRARVLARPIYRTQLPARKKRVRTAEGKKVFRKLKADPLPEQWAAWMQQKYDALSKGRKPKPAAKDDGPSSSDSGPKSFSISARAGD